MLGADRRRFMDTSLILLRIDEDTDEMEVVDTAEFVHERELQFKTELDAGKYILVPLTTGALLQRPFKAKDDKIQHKVEYQNITMPHPYFLTTLNDIFRKIDLALNGLLSAEELNQFGKIANMKKFTEITSKSFTSPEFANISCNEHGLTNLGFKQFLFRNFSEKEISNMLTKLGYDDGMYSTKSRVFVTSFQADSPLKVQINESIIGNLHTRAWDLFMNHHLMERKLLGEVVRKANYLFFRVNHPKCYGCSYGLANNTDTWLRVELDMTDSEN